MLRVPSSLTIVLGLLLQSKQGRTLLSSGWYVVPPAVTFPVLVDRDVTISSSSSRRHWRPQHGGRRHHAAPPDALRAVVEATFGLGCFWKPAESLLSTVGVIDTVVGYAGGSLGGGRPAQPPTYDDVCYGDAWVESVKVAYDDDVSSYEALLDRFLEELPDGTTAAPRQYAGIVFPENADQHAVATRWLRSAAVEQKEVSIEYDNNGGVLFYRAEEYHQRYRQKMRGRIIVAVVGLLVSSALRVVSQGDGVSFVSADLASQVQQGSVALVVAGVVYYGIVERLVDDDVRELPPGTFAAAASSQSR